MSNFTVFVKLIKCVKLITIIEVHLRGTDGKNQNPIPSRKNIFENGHLENTQKLRVLGVRKNSKYLVVTYRWKRQF